MNQEVKLKTIDDTIKDFIFNMKIKQALIIADIDNKAYEVLNGNQDGRYFYVFDEVLKRFFPEYPTTEISQLQYNNLGKDCLHKAYLIKYFVRKGADEEL